MSKRSYSLGLNCAHDAAACLVSDQGIEVAIKEERLVRRKHQGGFPEKAIAYCLESAGLGSISDVSQIVINQFPRMDCEFRLRAMGYEGVIDINPSHHLLHCYYAKYVSGDGPTMVVVADGSGYNFGEYNRGKQELLGDEIPDADAEEAESVFLVDSKDITLLHKRWAVWSAITPYFRFPSLGHVYSMASQYIFQDTNGWIYAGKVMGLAPYGSLDSSIPPVLTFSEGNFKIDLDWVWNLPPIVNKPQYWDDPIRQNIAARVQLDLENSMLKWLCHLKALHAIPKVCLTGGVAHNSVANGKIIEEELFDEVVFTPAADDSGTALGAALYGFEKLNGKPPNSSYSGDFHGRSYGRSEIDLAVSDTRVAATRFENKASFAADVASQLAEKRILAIFDGKSEFSARALGHRSILCDARGEQIKDKLNKLVKFREPFRPFAAMVLEDQASDYFELRSPSPYMMTVTNVVSDKISEIPAVCHVDGTCRLQTVSSKSKDIASLALREFYDHTEIPLLLNTSFNIRGEPIVESPQEAVDCFCSTGLDYLYIYPYRIHKHTDSDSLVPVLNPGCSIHSSRGPITAGGDCDETRYYIEARTGFRHPINYMDFSFISALGDGRTLTKLAEELERDVSDSIASLTEIGAISFKLACKEEKMKKEIDFNSRLETVYGSQDLYLKTESQIVSDTTKLLKNHKSFAGILRYLATERQQLARTQGSLWFKDNNPKVSDILEKCSDAIAKYVTPFGLPANIALWEKIGYDKPATDSSVLEDEIVRDLDLRGKNPKGHVTSKTPLYKEPRYVAHYELVKSFCMNKMRTTMQTSLNGQMLISADIIQKDPLKCDYTIYHMDPGNHCEVLEHLENIYSEWMSKISTKTKIGINDSLNSNPKSRSGHSILDDVIEIYYWMSISMFYCRGSSSITRWFCLSALNYLEIPHHKPSNDIYLDLDAILARSKNDFKNSFLTAFGIQDSI